MMQLVEPKARPSKEGKVLRLVEPRVGPSNGHNQSGMFVTTQRCFRCGGNITYGEDSFGLWVKCIQCGRDAG